MAQFEPGKSGNPAGRPKGSLNKLTVETKAALHEAFDELGGVASLVQWARRDPGAFYSLWVKTLPKDVNLGITETLSEILDGYMKRGKAE
jgi:hypothetical protein